MLQFFIGLIVGALIGVAMMALCVSSKKREEIYESPDFYEKMK